MQKNDVLWKGLIEDLFPAFIPFFLPAHQHLFDLEKPVEFLDKELQELFPDQAGNHKIRFVDQLVKVFSAEGEEKWLLIHIEVQGYQDDNFGERMFTYFYRILDRYRIPITAVAIFTDNSKSFLPDYYRYEFAGTEYIYRFNTYKVLQQDEKLLKQSSNPFAIAILTVLLALQKKKLDDNNLLDLKVALVRQMLAAGFSKKITGHLLNFIKRYVNFDKPEMRTKFEEQTDLLTGKRITMGLREQILQMEREEGRFEGKAEGKVEEKNLFVENLLRSTDFNDEKIASLAGVSIEFVQGVRSRLHL